MSKERHPSDSSEQIQAQKEILSLLNQEYHLSLTSKKILLDNTLFQSDGYSGNPPIICEIYSHIGKINPAQYGKITKDILKMLLIEKMSDKEYRKIIAFADEEAAQPFSEGESWYSKLKEKFDIEVIIIQIPVELKSGILEAQKRQYR